MTYLLQYLDKNSINFANTFGLQEGTGLHGQDYSWLGSSPVPLGTMCMIRYGVD